MDESPLGMQNAEPLIGPLPPAPGGPELARRRDVVLGSGPGRGRAWGPGRPEGLGRAAERWGAHHGLWGWAPAMDQAPASLGALTPGRGARTSPGRLEQLEAEAGGEVQRGPAQKSLEELGEVGRHTGGPRVEGMGTLQAPSDHARPGGRSVTMWGQKVPGPRGRAPCAGPSSTCQGVPQPSWGLYLGYGARERAVAGQPQAAQAGHPAVPGGHAAPPQPHHRTLT